MEAKAVSRAFADVAGLVKSVPLPIYNYCRIRNGRLTASNGVTDIDLPMVLDDLSPAGILLPAQEMSNLCKVLVKADCDIRMRQEGSRIYVTHNLGSVWLLGAHGDTAFPGSDLEPFMDPVGEWAIADLRTALRMVEPALSGTRGMQGVVAGAFLEVYPDGFSLVALDGPRLCAFQSHAADSNCIWKGILPKNTLTLLARRLASADQEGLVIFSGSRLGARFSFGEEHIGSRLIDGEFPDWRRALVARNDIPAVVPVDMLEQALSVCSITQEGSIMPIRLEFIKNRLSLSISTAKGEAQQALPVEYVGARLLLVVDGVLLAEALRAMQSANQDGNAVHLLHDGSPVRAVRMLTEDGRGICVIMPMRDTTQKAG